MKIVKKILGWLVHLCILAGLAAIFMLSYQFSYGAFSNEPAASNPNYKMDVVVEEGETPEEVAQQLYDKHMIRHPKQFLFRAKLSEYDGKIKPGTYEVSAVMGIDDILKRLTQMEEAK